MIKGTKGIIDAYHNLINHNVCHQSGSFISCPINNTLLVQSHSLRTYSKPIQNIINYISFNLTADLSLNALSEEFMLNSSYLSTLFKKETGVTLTNFVNNKRIEHAIYLLNTTQSAIQDIAAQCGINDVNYFTKLFKKLKNMTPTQYREMIQHK